MDTTEEEIQKPIDPVVEPVVEENNDIVTIDEETE